MDCRRSCNFAARRDETLADDLDAGPGGVSTRVALLLRGTEPKPASATLVIIHLPINIPGKPYPILEGIS